MITNKDLRVEGSNLIINGEKHPLDPAVNALTKRANIVQGKFTALDTKLDAIEALEKTASGNPISITGAAAAYAMSNIMNIEPIQSGSGDPSPDNVRPISGISTASVQTTDGTDTNTASITLGQTVYGGSVNFKKGELTLTHKLTTVGAISWTIQVSNFANFTTSSLSSEIKKSSDEEVAKSDIYISTTNSAPNPTPYSIYGNTRGDLKINDRRYLTVEDWLADCASAQILYELETPLTLTLTPAELELLKGNNTISGNGVTINISYLGR